jgi:hypothetical protein
VIKEVTQLKNKRKIYNTDAVQPLNPELFVELSEAAVKEVTDLSGQRSEKVFVESKDEFKRYIDARYKDVKTFMLNMRCELEAKPDFIHSVIILTHTVRVSLYLANAVSHVQME